MTRLRYVLALLVLSLMFAGCNEPVQFHAFVEPPRGHVPYEARIVCTPLEGTYSYRLPDGSVIESKASELAVTVDRLDWEASVSWTNGEQARTQVVAAHGTNALPTILPPRINGDPSRWYLRPRERTLIDFTHYSAGLSGPESGVVYGGPWRVVAIQVECHLKTLCGMPVGDSVFCPPYEAGHYHGLFGGQVYDNACIVYPLYTGELAPDGRPYPPAPEQGYTVDTARVRNVFDRVEFPAQSATVSVVVEDEWGRQVAASFDVPVEAAVYLTEGKPPTDYSKLVFYVASRISRLYHLSTCVEVCGIRAADRLYFSSEASASAAGRERCPACLGVPGGTSR